MKKLISFILLIFMIITCVACDDNNTSSSEESSSIEQAPESSNIESESQQESSSSKVESETKSESQSESDSATQTELESQSESESDSKIESESELESKIETESETEAIKIPLSEFGQFSSKITATKQSADRLKQMSAAANTYGKGATCTDAELNSTISSARKIKTSGALIGYSNASKLIEHFLNNSGEDYEIDVSSFLKDSNALATRNEELNKALRACEALAIEGEAIDIFQKEELVHHNLTGDWKFAVGSYFTSIEVKSLTVNGNIYTATIIYNVTDFYNWDFNNDTPVFSGFAASIVGDVSPKDLHQLHRAGLAQEFLSHGEISYTISWVKGSTVDMIPTLK